MRIATVGHCRVERQSFVPNLAWARPRRVIKRVRQISGYFECSLENRYVCVKGVRGWTSDEFPSKRHSFSGASRPFWRSTRRTRLFIVPVSVRRRSGSARDEEHRRRRAFYFYFLFGRMDGRRTFPNRHKRRRKKRLRGRKKTILCGGKGTLPDSAPPPPPPRACAERMYRTSRKPMASLAPRRWRCGGGGGGSF